MIVFHIFPTITMQIFVRVHQTSLRGKGSDDQDDPRLQGLKEAGRVTTLSKKSTLVFDRLWAFPRMFPSLALYES